MHWFSYYTAHWTKLRYSINVGQLKGPNCTRLITDIAGEPYAIAVNPARGWVVHSRFPLALKSPSGRECCKSTDATSSDVNDPRPRLLSGVIHRASATAKYKCKRQCTSRRKGMTGNQGRVRSSLKPDKQRKILYCVWISFQCLSKAASQLH